MNYAPLVRVHLLTETHRFAGGHGFFRQTTSEGTQLVDIAIGTPIIITRAPIIPARTTVIPAVVPARTPVIPARTTVIPAIIAAGTTVVHAFTRTPPVVLIPTAVTAFDREFEAGVSKLIGHGGFEEQADGAERDPPTSDQMAGCGRIDKHFDLVAIGTGIHRPTHGSFQTHFGEQAFYPSLGRI
jgi:hypothetical protein